MGEGSLPATNGKKARQPVVRTPPDDGTAAQPPRDILSAFTNTTDGVVAVDRSGRIVLWNRAAEALFGLSAGSVLGRRCYDILCGRDERRNLLCHAHCHVLAMAERNEPAHPYDLLTRAAPGGRRWFNVGIVLLPAARGNIAVHFFRDITTRRPLLAAEAAPDGAGSARRDRASAASLTPREREVLWLLASGESTRAIARRLFISQATVRNHTQSVLAKLGVHSRLAAVARALELRVV